MKCGDEMGLLLSNYVDGEVSGEEKTLVENHTVECPECARMLDIFRRNERMVGDAIQNKAFGNEVLDGVLKKLDDETIPAEPARVFDWQRWIPAAAAAAVLLLLYMGLVLPLQGKYDDAITAFVAQYEQSQMEAEQARLQTEEQQAQLNRLRKELFAEDVKPEGRSILAIVSDHFIRIKAEFADTAQFDSFSVKRRKEGDKTWRVVAQDLLSPDFKDEKAKPGEIYFYKFVAQRKTGGAVESIPQRAMLPAPHTLDPYKSYRIRCINVNVEKGLAVFKITVYIDKNPRSWDFTVYNGETLGQTISLPKLGQLEFSTGLRLSGVDRGEQNLFMELVSGDDVVPARVHGRMNEKAVLYDPSTKKRLTVWKGQSVLIPIR